MKEKSGEELVLLAASVAIKIAKGADTDELQILSDFFGDGSGVDIGYCR